MDFLREGDGFPCEHGRRLHHRRRYGYRRIRDQLATDQGITCAPARVRRIMLERGLKAIQPKTYVPRTSYSRADNPSPNLVLNQALTAMPNQVWAVDITFIPTSAGWALADHLRTKLVSDALKQALGSGDTVPDLIFQVLTCVGAMPFSWAIC